VVQGWAPSPYTTACDSAICSSKKHIYIPSVYNWLQVQVDVADNVSFVADDVALQLPWQCRDALTSVMQHSHMQPLMPAQGIAAHSMCMIWALSCTLLCLVM
jgi:hypothetical protein